MKKTASKDLAAKLKISESRALEAVIKADLIAAVVKVAKKKGEPAIQPTIETTLNKTYPIARPMFMYTPGTPPAHIQKYLDWVMSDAGQKIVKDTGYIPLPKK